LGNNNNALKSIPGLWTAFGSKLSVILILFISFS